MLLLWVLNRNSGLSNILDKPAQSALTFKINFEERKFCHGESRANDTILSFASNKNICKLRERSTHFFLQFIQQVFPEHPLYTRHYSRHWGFLRMQNRPKKTPPRYKTLQSWGL